MKRLFYILVGLSTSLLSMAQLPMQGWKMHLAYNYVTRVEMATDKVFGLSEGALFSVDKEDQLLEYYNKLTGLNSTNIADFSYDYATNTLVIAYVNGHIDLLKSDEVTNIPDLYNKQLSVSKAVRHIHIANKKAYLSMDFGIVVLNLTRGEIADTYYIGENSAEVKVSATTVIGDSIYAATGGDIYVACLKDNIVDYSYWKKRAGLPGRGNVLRLVSYENDLCMVRDSLMYVCDEATWKQPLGSQKLHELKVSGGQLLGLYQVGTWVFNEDYTYEFMNAFSNAPDVSYDKATGSYWYAYYKDGLGYWNPRENQSTCYTPVGPLGNTAYRMRFSGDRLYIVPGGYLGVPYIRPGNIMWYEDGKWDGITTAELQEVTGLKKVIDFCDVAADPTDPNHFYVASYGNGLLEFKDNQFYTRYDESNSGLKSRIASNPSEYTRVDALIYDAAGNLWMQNCSKSSTRVLTTDGNWYNFPNANNVDYKVPKVLLIDNQNPNRKIFINADLNPGISILDDGGTIDKPNDDKSVFWNTFVDEDGNTLIPDNIFCGAQDQNGALWAGTKSGVLRFSQPASLFESNACSRIKIARQDGSGLADYLLNDEQINAIAVDGANRIWFGTEGSGAYLMDLSDPQNIITVHHYTTDNSPLPSNTIISIVINPLTGEVFFGTGGGLVSYQSDAAGGKEDYSSAYAYPNPVRENFDGVITIAGLMDDTQVRITDNGGNLVYETKSNGGLAIWDGRNGKGERVSSGVYFAMCVTADGASKTLVKILVMN